MATLFDGFDYVQAYTVNLLIITKKSYDDHLQKLDKVFEKLLGTRLKVNIKKSSFATSKLEYLGYQITCQGIQPSPKKVQAIQNLALPTNTKEV
jgi:hypothetical protein